jgi:hypothetical protein
MMVVIDPNTSLTNEDSVLKAEEHHLYQLRVKSCLYLVTWTTPDHAYPLLYFSQVLPGPSKSHHIAAKRVLLYFKRTKDLNLACPHSDSKITNERYSYPDYGKGLDTQQSNSGLLYQLNNSMIVWHFKRQ